VSKELTSVLLVDDDPHTCNIFRVVMDHHDLELKVAKNAEEAFEILKTFAPNVIVLDIFLPGTDGYQMFNRIRQNNMVPNAAIIATTAYYTETTQSDVLARGFQGYLPKPFESGSLVPYLKNALQSK
jgi:CheY-like chemotaxis protein